MQAERDVHESVATKAAPAQPPPDAAPTVVSADGDLGANVELF